MSKMDREGEGEPQTREERIKKRRQRLESKMEARKLGTEEGKLSKEQVSGHVNGTLCYCIRMLRPTSAQI